MEQNPGKLTAAAPSVSSAETHLLSSVSMITEAIELADSGCAAVLGCGAGAEIPIRLLNEKFDLVDLVDIDRDALRLVEAQCRQWNDAKNAYRFHVADLTGLIATVERRAVELVSEAGNPINCLEQLGTLLESTTPAFWYPPHQQRYAFIICATVLTQLQATVRESVERIFLGRFPEQADALFKHEPWRRSAWNFARKLEDAFISHLGELARPGTVVFLSATVHVSWLTQIDERSVATQGRWVATRTSRLTDYLCPNDTIIAERSWDWLRQEVEGQFWGRLYGVQAVIYRTAADSTSKRRVKRRHSSRPNTSGDTADASPREAK